MSSTTAKGIPKPDNPDAFDVVAAFAAFAAWLDARPGVAAYSTTARDLLVGADIWSGRVIYNTTNQRLEVNLTGTAGAANWSSIADAIALATAAASTQGFGDAAAVGTATTAARADHKHAMPTHDDAAHAAIHLSALAAALADVSMGGKKLTNVGTPLSAGDGAPKGYVDAAIAALVNTAPGTLDTLNELATALGDDPNFAATMTAALATKATSASPTLTGTIGIGGVDTDVEERKAVTIQNDTRSQTFTYTGSNLTQIVEKSGATTVKTTTLSYTGSNITGIVEVAGGVTVTTTLSYTGSNITGITKAIS